MNDLRTPSKGRVPTTGRKRVPTQHHVVQTYFHRPYSSVFIVVFVKI